MNEELCSQAWQMVQKSMIEVLEDLRLNEARDPYQEALYLKLGDLYRKVDLLMQMNTN